AEIHGPGRYLTTRSSFTPDATARRGSHRHRRAASRRATAPTRFDRANAACRAPPARSLDFYPALKREAGRELWWSWRGRSLSQPPATRPPWAPWLLSASPPVWQWSPAVQVQALPGTGRSSA